MSQLNYVLVVQTSRLIETIPLRNTRERSGSVVGRLSRDRGVAGSRLTSVTALCP